MVPARITITLRWTCSPQLAELIADRFDLIGRPGDCTLLLDGLDQAALRALLALLWDAGHEVVALTSEPPPGTASPTELLHASCAGSMPARKALPS
ncbi:hypothetical protein GCM10022236_17210 [Microlunatus ginsengisoli]|uniref:STAS domain-containing protein n=1 Tax=Microlunatus ginsengisoli TaxID=363863 RepID=A0ABP6ZS46_9ACTN